MAITKKKRAKTTVVCLRDTGADTTSLVFDVIDQKTHKVHRGDPKAELQRFCHGKEGVSIETSAFCSKVFNKRKGESVWIMV